MAAAFWVCSNSLPAPTSPRPRAGKPASSRPTGSGLTPTTSPSTAPAPTPASPPADCPPRPPAECSLDENVPHVRQFFTRAQTLGQAQGGGQVADRILAGTQDG